MNRIVIFMLAIIAIIRPALSHETGLASIHAWRKEGGRICMADHFHDGAGRGPSRSAAVTNAIRSWASFTVLEYGERWGSYGRAASKSMRCAGAGHAWHCEVSARPCRR